MITPLEIHHINVSQGDSTLIIHRNLDKTRAAIENVGYIPPNDVEDYMPFAVKYGINLKGTIEHAVLIDGGDYEFTKCISDYLKKYGICGDVGDTERSSFTAILTHRHADHREGLRSCFWKDAVVETTQQPRIVDRRGKIMKYYPDYPPHKIYDDNCQTLGGMKSGMWNSEYEEDLNYLMIEAGQITQRCEMIPGTVIEMGEYAGEKISLECIYANGYMLENRKPKKYKVLDNLKKYALPKGEKGRRIGADPNALSICMVLSFGAFKYFLGGDIAGNGVEEGGNTGKCKYHIREPNNNIRSKVSSHPDTETSLKEKLSKLYPMKGHMCGFKANHHGSGSSNDIHFLATMRPVLAVFSCGHRKRFHKHPDKAVIERVDFKFSEVWADWQSEDKGTSVINNTIKNYYLTEVVQRDNHGNEMNLDLSNGKILGDIIVRPNALQIKKNGGAIDIQVYGTGAQHLKADDFQLRPCGPLNENGIYPIGPFNNTCTCHKEE